MSDRLRRYNETYLSADCNRDPGPLLECAHVFRQELLRQHGVLPTRTEWATETMVVLESAPRHSWLKALLGPSGVDLSPAHPADTACGEGISPMRSPAFRYYQHIVSGPRPKD